MIGLKRIWLGWLIVAAVAGWLLWMTLRSNPAVADNLAPLTEPAADRGISRYLLIDLVGNVVVFVPLGAVLLMALGRRSSRPWLLAILVGAGFSLSIELMHMALPSRVSSVGDWGLNTLGVVAGVFLWALIPTCGHPYLVPRGEGDEGGNGRRTGDGENRKLDSRR